MVDVLGPIADTPTWTWILFGIGLYWLAVLWLRDAGYLPEYVGTQGPILTLHTRRFREFVDRVASPKRAWRVWGNLGVGVALVIMVGMFLFLLITAIGQLQNPPQPSTVNRPQNFLVIPGVNEFLPLSVAPEIVFGLLVGLVVHEGGHAILCRVGDIEIESMGLALLAILPIGAFVEPDEDSRRVAERGDQTRMFAAGVMNNFALTIVVFLLLFGPVTGAIAVASGAAISGAYDGSPAEEAGIDRGDRIVAVEGQPVANNSDLEPTLAGIDAESVEVRVDGQDGTRTVTVERSLFVVGVTQGYPFDAVDASDRIVAVNGTPVATTSALPGVIGERRVVTLETANGTTATGPVGAAVVFTEDGPATSSGVEPGAAVVTAIDGERTVSSAELTRILEGTEPGQTVRVELYRDGERTVRPVELGEHPAGNGLLGVQVYRGFSGLVVNDFGVGYYPAGSYLALMSGDVRGSLSLNTLFGGRTGLLTGIAGVQFLPMISLLDPTLPSNFAGFTGVIANFYAVPGLPAGATGLVLGLANVLFWAGWINFNLGIFNCIPAFPLDGGHILRTSTESIVSRLPIQDRRRATTVVTTGVGLVMLLSLVLMLFGPQLLT